jgi:hypothetical protein
MKSILRGVFQGRRFAVIALVVGVVADVVVTAWAPCR